MLATIAISQEEHRAGQISPETLAQACQLFASNGTLVIKNVLPPDLVSAMHAAMQERYQEYMVEQEHTDALRVGNKRYMVTLSIESPFDTPALYASPFVDPIMSTFLSREYILGAFGAVISLPGARAQHLHQDSSGLFPDEGLDGMLPPFAITMIVPLIEVNETTGTTLVWPQSHRVVRSQYSESDAEWPLLALGDCLLMDYRLLHRGSANNSDQARPILYNIYSRPWFRDHVNYEKQNRLVISDKVLSQVPEPYRHIFAHVASDEADFIDTGTSPR